MMKELALNLPTYGKIDGPAGFKFAGAKIGDVVSSALDLVIMIAAFLAFIWLVWGAFQYLFSGGNKEGLAKARSRMIWAIVGLIFIAAAFALAQFIEQILGPQVTSPISLNIVTTVYAQAPLPTVSLEKEYGFGNILSLGEGFNRLIVPGFSIATTAVVIYFLIGAIKLLASGGDKGSVSSAKDMITHAIIGFLLIIFIFIIMQYIPEVFGFNINIFG